jgi:aspartate ammonia-lyase
MNEIVANFAAVTDLDESDVHRIVDQGSSLEVAAGEWLFHEGSPREHLIIIKQGEVEVLRGMHGDERVIAVFGPGTVIGEGLLLDDQPHTASARCRADAVVHLVARAVFASLQREHPDLYYRLVARVARLLSDRLRRAADVQPPIAVPRGARLEHDLLGSREVPQEALYGVQTLRACENFPLSGVRLGQFGHLLSAFAYVKKAAALANADAAGLDRDKCDAIVAACDEIAAGGLREHFVVDMIQGGAGTSTNMNFNEVIANRALELLGNRRGDYHRLHPNDDVNRSQSTNDAYPTAVKLAVHLAALDAVGALDELRVALAAKSVEFADVLKMGRTEMQDAVPMTLGQEFGAYAVMVGETIRAIRSAADELLDVNLGATAIGTGLNAPAGYAESVAAHLAEASGLPVRLAADLVEATQDAGEFVSMSAAMKRCAVQVSKIANDLRLLSSGPRAGLAEIRLPPMQPGSSIMPGKVNPVIPEVVTQVCYQIMGYDVTIAMAAESGQLELNMAEPIMAYDLLHGLSLLRNVAIIFASRCIVGIEADREACQRHVDRSIGVVTALNPVLGYERSATIAKEALETGRGVVDLVLERGWLSRSELDTLLAPMRMADPRRPAGQ